MGKRILIIQQRDIADCGAACLASVAAFYRLHIPLSRIRQYAGTDRQGTNVAGMIEAAERLGFQAKGVKGVRESLAQIPLPAIAHVKLENGLQHYVVIYKVNEKKLYLMDPGPGIQHRVDKDVFCSEWTGVLILLMPGASFQVVNAQVNNVPLSGIDPASWWDDGPGSNWCFDLYYSGTVRFCLSPENSGSCAR
jgi:ABC-type bacteriocin/lantibiotic exporter with double-glycine peptidase domain